MDKKISQLPLASTVEQTDNFVVSRSGSNVRIPATILFNTSPTFPGCSQVSEQITTSGAISMLHHFSEIVTTNTPLSLTLGVGVAGQEKIIVFRNKGTANVTISPSGAIGYSSITLTATGDSVLLKYISNSWVIISTHGATVI